MYKDTYRKAVEFFDGNSINVEVRLQEKLYRVFFPKMPMCKYFDSPYRERFRNEANRISQISKLHSLMETATKTIDELELEENWQNRINEVHPFLNYFFNFNLIMNVTLLIGVFLTVLYIIVTVTPQFTYPFDISSILPYQGILFLVVTAFCALISLLLALVVLFKRIPASIMRARR